MHPLSTLEEELKRLALEYPQIRTITHLHARDLPRHYNMYAQELSDVLPFSLTSSVEEGEVIKPEEHISVSFHPRYLPAVIHQHPFFELFFVSSGSCTQHLNGIDMKLSTGDLCILAPRCEHAISAFQDDAEIINILIRSSTFETAFFDILSKEDILSVFFSHALYSSSGESALTFHTGDDHRLQTLFRIITQEASANELYKDQMLVNYLSAAFIFLMRHHEKDAVLPTSYSGRNNQALMDIFSYLQNHYVELTLSSLAAHFNYSERHISRLLQNSTGMSFSQISRRMKLTKAAELLANPALSVSDICTRVGYCDVSTFYKAFKAYYKMNPAEYRRVHEKN